MDNNNQIETQSIASSMVSNASKRISKHCSLCNNQLFKRWSDHIAAKHNGDKNNKGIDCRTDSCVICLNQEVKSELSHHSKKSNRNTKIQCIECYKPKRSDILDKTSGKCVPCLKKDQSKPFKHPKSVAIVKKSQPQLNLIGKRLTAEPTSLVNKSQTEQYSSTISDQLDDMDLGCDMEVQDIQCTERPGSKSPYKRLNTQSLTTLNKEYNNQQKVSSFTHQIVPAPVTPIVIEQGIRDDGVLVILRELEENIEKTMLKESKVLSIISFFTQQVVIVYLNTKPAPVLTTIIQQLMNRVDIFNESQLVNIAFAAALLGIQTWQNLPTFIGAIEDKTIQQNVLERLHYHLARYFVDPVIAYWITQNWQYLTASTLELALNLKNKHSLDASFLLDISLVVNSSDNIEDFRQICSMFVHTKRAFEIFQEAVNRQPQQSKLSISYFIDLVSELTKHQNIDVLKEQETNLIAESLDEWINLIQQWRIKSLIQDVDSVSSQVKFLEDKYGKLPGQFKGKTVSEAVPSFAHVLHKLHPQPSNMQIAMAWYCATMIFVKPLQLVQFGAGQGKSFIQKLIAFFLLKTQSTQHVHLVYTSQHLLRKDQETFQQIMTEGNLEDASISFQLGLNFHREPTDVILVDEADQLIFSEPDSFKVLSQQNNYCICLTATCDDNDAQGIERSIIQHLNFSIIAHSEISLVTTMQPPIDKIISSKNEDICQFIKETLQRQAVLLYCTEQLRNYLDEQQMEFLYIDQCSSATTTIASMDLIQPNGQYLLVVSTNPKVGMRGLDYRAPLNGITLILAASFENQRESIQASYRVGRYKDHCVRVCVENVPSVCPDQSSRYFRKLVAFVESYSKKIVAKIPVPSIQKNKAPTASSQRKKVPEFAEKSQNKITQFIVQAQQKTMETKKNNSE